MIYRLRCRLGAWLLREHVAASLENVEYAKTYRPENRERLDYKSIGLKQAVGAHGWRRFDDEEQWKHREAARQRAHALDPL